MFPYARNILIQDPAQPASGGAKYRPEVVKVLDLISTTQSGRILIKFIKLTPNQLKIVPFVPSADLGPVNAAAGADNWHGAVPLNTTLMTEAPGSPVGGITIMVPTNIIGTGAGSAVTLQFHPANAKQVIANKGGRIDPGDGPGEKLFHEMVHALRMLKGLYFNPTESEGIPEGIHMDDREEFYAIATQNLYRYERGFKTLRKDHRDHVALGSAFADSDSYYEEFKESFKEYFNTQRAFCLELTNVRAKFNPFLSAAIDLGLRKPPPVPMALGRR